MMTPFQKEITQGLPEQLPVKRSVPGDVNRAPKRKDILSAKEKKLALENALRYFPVEWHEALATEFLEELKEFGRIYMYRFKPSYDMHARPIEDYPCKTPGAAAIMLMIQNNLDPAVAQHPEELITYGGNGAVFQNWAQYLLTMKYLSEMTEEQTPTYVQRPPNGPLPFFQRSTARGGDQRNDDSKLQPAGRLGKIQCPRRYPIRSNDGRFLHVHRATRDRTRNNHHRIECGTHEI